jgi:hypothetical protein
MKRPRYEVDSGFCQVRPILADTINRHVHFNNVT